MQHIQIKTLGEFSLQAGENRISEKDKRSRKVWQLLAYLLFHRNRATSPQKLIELLWGDEPASTNPENALRITLHRMRTLLNSLWPNAGRDMILYKDNGYIWNDAIAMTVDAEEFEGLCSQKTEDASLRIAAYREAIGLYRGDFLDSQSSDAWTIPYTTHFHNLYVSIVLELAELLSGRGDHKEAANICKEAVAAEPYHEPLHQLLIRELAAAGDQKGAAEVYESLSKRLFDDFGIRPNEETRAAYRAAVHALSENALPMDVVLEHLQEPDSAAGAMRCDYDYFKVLCYAESRAMERNGNVTHVALMSLSGDSEKPLTKRSKDRIMEQLGEQIRTNLRRGDTFSRCSVSQYIIMLPNANYENSCMVCRRILGAFNRRHPHVTAKIHFMVQPLTPGICVP